uniref:hypothetical protein n=1 Tax=Kocuria rhizophila TaxID=72000 RepID=UPI00164278DB
MGDVVGVRGVGVVERMSVGRVVMGVVGGGMVGVVGGVGDGWWGVGVVWGGLGWVRRRRRVRVRGEVMEWERGVVRKWLLGVGSGGRK